MDGCVGCGGMRNTCRWPCTNTNEAACLAVSMSAAGEGSTRTTIHTVQEAAGQGDMLCCATTECCVWCTEPCADRLQCCSDSHVSHKPIGHTTETPTVQGYYAA